MEVKIIMEGQTVLNEVLKALSLHSEKMEQRFEQIDQRFEQIDRRFEQIDLRFEQMEQRFDKMDVRFDRLEKKVDGIRVELTETQETTDFVAKKTIDRKSTRLNSSHVAISY